MVRKRAKLVFLISGKFLLETLTPPLTLLRLPQKFFRALWGYYDPADDHWAYNYSLINEWKIFLKKDAMFKHFLP
jgi:hypothetical protein